jgi:hypothetical protein
MFSESIILAADIGLHNACSLLVKSVLGGVAERFKAHAWKACWG